jgi:hypothetical protein
MKKRLEATLKKIDFLETELEWQDDILTEQHGEFDCYWRDWCEGNGIELPTPPAPPTQKQPSEEEEEPVDVEVSEETLLGREQFKVTYKKLAMATHPDKNEGDDTDFKVLNGAWTNGTWSKILSLANKYDIPIHNVKEIDKLLRQEAMKMEQIVEKNSNMFSWKFWECGDDEKCKEKLIKHFLKTINKIKKGE